MRNARITAPTQHKQLRYMVRLIGPIPQEEQRLDRPAEVRKEKAAPNRRAMT
jgi:hypothetical protein